MKNKIQIKKWSKFQKIKFHQKKILSKMDKKKTTKIYRRILIGQLLCNLIVLFKLRKKKKFKNNH